MGIAIRNLPLDLPHFSRSRREPRGRRIGPSTRPGETPAVQERPFSWSGVVLPRMLPSRPRLVAFRRSTGHQIDWERLTVRRLPACKSSARSGETLVAGGCRRLNGVLCCQPLRVDLHQGGVGPCVDEMGVGFEVGDSALPVLP